MPCPPPEAPRKILPPPDHHDHLHAQLAHFGDLPGHVAEGFGANADALLSAESLAAEFEKDSPVFRFQYSSYTCNNDSPSRQCVAAF